MVFIVLSSHLFLLSAHVFYAECDNGTQQDYQVSPAEYTIALKYINTIKTMATRAGARKVYLPYEVWDEALK